MNDLLEALNLIKNCDNFRFILKPRDRVYDLRYTISILDFCSRTFTDYACIDYAFWNELNLSFKEYESLYKSVKEELGEDCVDLSHNRLSQRYREMNKEAENY